MEKSVADEAEELFSDARNQLVLGVLDQAESNCCKGIHRVPNSALGWQLLGLIYEAYDKVLQQDVAIKVEKKDKNKNILIFEFQVLNNLKGNSLN